MPVIHKIIALSLIFSHSSSTFRSTIVSLVYTIVKAEHAAIPSLRHRVRLISFSTRRPIAARKPSLARSLAPCLGFALHALFVIEDLLVPQRRIDNCIARVIIWTYKGKLLAHPQSFLLLLFLLPHSPRKGGGVDGRKGSSRIPKAFPISVAFNTLTDRS